MIEDYWIKVSGSDLLTDISEYQDESLCVVNFLPSVDDFWVFGNPIYKDYYIFHDPVTPQMGFAPTELSRKEPLIYDVRPTASMD